MASRGLDALPLTARDFNPPLYYLLLYLWMQLAGSSEAALRSLSVVFFVATLWVAWRFMIDLLAIPARRAAAYLVLFAVNPVLTYYAVEARMYSLLAFLAAASFYSYQARRPALYILSTTAGLYTHYFMLLVVAVQVLATLMTLHEARRWKRRALILLTPVLLLVPWLIVVVAVREGNASEFWIAPLNWRFGLHILTAIYTGHDATYGFLGRSERWLFALCLLAVVAWSLRAVRRSAAERRPVSLLVALWALAPPLVVFGISFVQPVFLPRYLLFASVGLLLLLACGLEAAAPRLRFALLVILSALAIRYQLLQVHHHSKGDDRDTIRAIARRRSQRICCTSATSWISFRRSTTSGRNESFSTGDRTTRFRRMWEEC